MYAVDFAGRHARQVTECQQPVMRVCHLDMACLGLACDMWPSLSCRKALKKAMNPKVAGQEAAELARCGLQG